MPKPKIKCKSCGDAMAESVATASIFRLSFLPFRGKKDGSTQDDEVGGEDWPTMLNVHREGYGSGGCGRALIRKVTRRDHRTDGRMAHQKRDGRSVRRNAFVSPLPR